MSEKINSDAKKRQKKINRILTAFNVIVILAVLAFGFIYLLFMKRETVSHEENRNLAKLPKLSISSYFKGDLTSGIADYYDDTVHNRSRIKGFISSHLLPLKGRSFGEDGIIIIGKPQKEDDTLPEQAPATEAPTDTQPAQTESPVDTPVNPPVDTPVEPPVDTPVQPPVDTPVQPPVDTPVQPPVNTPEPPTNVPDNVNPEANGEISDGIVIVNKRGVMLFGGGMKGGIEYAQSLNAYKRDLGNVNVYSMVCPTPVSYYLPSNYQSLTASEKDNIDNINSALVDVTPVDAYTALLFHKQEPIYSRTDHHWQPLGAYYAAEEFARVAGVEFAPLSSYTPHTLSGYVGTLYGYTKSSVLLNNPEDFTYYEPTSALTVTRYNKAFKNPTPSKSLLNDPTHMSKSSYYMVFGGDNQITHVNTSCKNGRTLVIFKDSYGNALLPVLTGSFENIYLCDIRYFDLNAVKFCKDVGATDLLFAMCTFSAVGVNHKRLEPNRTR